jgi:endonuclease YncB( thermonuclease family)
MSSYVNLTASAGYSQRFRKDMLCPLRTRERSGAGPRTRGKGRIRATNHAGESHRKGPVPFRFTLLRTALASGAVSLIVFSALLAYRRHAPPDEATSALPLAPLSARAPQATPLDPAPSPAAAPLAPPPGPITVEPPFTILDGLTFQSGDQILRLARLEGPPRDAACIAATGLPWACGLRARAALNNLISRRSLTCEPVGRDSKAVIVDCRGEGRDIGGELVAAGWARPPLDDRQAYAAQLQAARTAKAGLWDGGWRLRTEP